MKKLLFSTLFVIAIAATGFSQCTIDLTCTSLVCPDTVTNLPHAQVGVLYVTSMTVAIPTDTTMSGIPVTVDSLKYNSITGLPTGYSATPDSVVWLGGHRGCLLITGTTTLDQVGTHSLIIGTTAYGKMYGTSVNSSFPLTGYKIIVDNPNGISDNNSNKFAIVQNSPNPFSSSTIIDFTSPVEETYHFTVISVIGDEVYSQNINAVSGKNSIEFSASDLPAGIYMYKLSNKTTSLTKRMIIKK